MLLHDIHVLKQMKVLHGPGYLVDRRSHNYIILETDYSTHLQLIPDSFIFSKSSIILLKIPMATIETILEYNLTEHEKTCLFQCGITNGIGGEGKNIEKALFENIKLLPWYDPKKAHDLIDDIRELSVEHDIQYTFKMWFYRSNFKFAKKLYLLLHWSGWKRLWVAFIAFLILNKCWKKLYFSKNWV